MSDELKAAAERIRHMNAGGVVCDVPEYANHEKTPIHDRIRLSNAYLSDLAACEAEEAERALPVDEEWLLSTGGVRDGCWLNISCDHCTLAFIVDDEAEDINEVKVESIECSGPWVPCSTRGQVLDLLKALGMSE